MIDNVVLSRRSYPDTIGPEVSGLESWIYVVEIVVVALPRRMVVVGVDALLSLAVSSIGAVWFSATVAR